jgi:hypothetical protein
MASLFFSVDVWRALREVIPAENIVAHEAVTLQDAITDFLQEQLSDHPEFRDLPDPVLAFVEGRVKVQLAL